MEVGMKKENIIYYKRWAKIASQMDDELRLIFFDTLNAYVLDGAVPTEENPLYWTFLLMLEQVNVDERRYEDISEKRKEAAKKKWEKPQSSANGCKSMQTMQMHANDADKDKDKVNVNDKGNDKDNGNISTLSGTMDSLLSSSLHSEDSIIKGTNVPTSSDDDAKLMLTPPDGDCESKKDYSYKVMKFWNNVMKSPVAIPTIAKMTPKRKTVVNARVKEFGINAVYQAISKASESSFLNGGGSKGFLADFDWVFRPNNFPKVLEGNYDDVKPINKNGNGTNQQQSREQREEDLRAKERLEFIATKYGDIG